MPNVTVWWYRHDAGDREAAEALAERIALTEGVHAQAEEEERP